MFVDTQQKCDTLFQDLSRAGYNGLSLHGGKDQTDRDFTIADFKNKAATLMVATSVAGRCVRMRVRESLWALGRVSLLSRCELQGNHREWHHKIATFPIVFAGSTPSRVML